MGRFRKDRRDDLEERLRDGPQPRDEFLEGLVRRARGRRNPVRRRPMALAAGVTGAMVLGLGATGGLGAAGSTVESTVGSIKAIFIPDSDPPKGTVKGQSHKPAKPARDQYTRPGKGCGDHKDSHGKPCPVPTNPKDDKKPPKGKDQAPPKGTDGQPPIGGVLAVPSAPGAPVTGSATSPSQAIVPAKRAVKGSTARKRAKAVVARRYRASFRKRTSGTARCAPLAGPDRWRCVVTWRSGKYAHKAVVVLTVDGNERVRHRLSSMSRSPR